MVISSKPTSGESARFHLSDYRLVARITPGLCVNQDCADILEKWNRRNTFRATLRMRSSDRATNSS